MRRQWLKFFVVPIIAIAVTGFAVTVRKATRGKQVSENRVFRSQTLRVNEANAPAVGIQANTHVVRLLAPQDAQFDSMLESAYPGLRIDPAFQSLRQNTALVSNESGQAIYGVVVKWILQTEGGVPTVTYDPYVESAGRDRLITQGVVLTPNEVRLFTPSMTLKKGQTPNGVIAQLRSNRPVLKHETVLNSSLDGVIFGDSTFVGLDEAKLLDRFECDRNGQHDEGYSMTLALRSQPSDDEIAARLNEHIQKRWTYSARTDREALYYISRANEAQLLLQLLRQSGRAKFEQAVTRLAKMTPTRLRKL